MRSLIYGENYNFRVTANGAQFYIEAIHVPSLRSSFINNLNPILSEYNINIDDEKVSESQWLLPKRQIKSFFNKAIKFLSDKTYRNYLEKILDEDKRSGEWG